MALSVEELRGHVQTQLGDAELTLLLNAAYDAITERYGPSGSITERRVGASGRLLMLAHRASAVTAVVEDGDTLAANEYALRPRGRQVERKDTGTNPGSLWRGYVDVTYTNGISDSQRDRVAIALVKLDVNYQPGLTGERLGDWQASYAANSVFNYEIEREAILASLEPDELVVF
ncbi:MAG: hypothetical protein IT341_10620 [Chloroflexi bacterium]|nr:hypothetical protein [Chloroflexota bacterium]